MATINDTKNVVLIGLTANGKSSLVREILSYGGEHSKAKKVKIGDGNLSETQKCSEHLVKVPIKEHFLRSTVTHLRVQPTAETNRSGVEQAETHLMEWLDLNIVDTPGLSDSGNMNEHGLKYSRKFGPLKDRVAEEFEQNDRIFGDDEDFREKDERHKVRIFKAIAKLNTVHAICFVVLSRVPFSGVLQRVISQLWAVFSQTFYPPHAVGYHIIHTESDFEDRFSDFTEVRQRLFKTACPGVKATHHFLENDPLSSPISCHFAKVALANLFLSIRNAQGASTDVLRYPKLSTHRYNDAILINGLEELIRRHTGDTEALTRQRQLKDGLRADLSDKISQCEANLNAIVSDIEGPRWNSLCVIDQDSCIANYEYFGPCVGSVTITHTKFPIDHVEYENVEKKNGKWIYQHTDTDSGRVEAKLQVQSFWGNGQVIGNITLKTKKRNYDKNGWDRQTQQRENKRGELKKLRGKQTQVVAEIGEINEKIDDAATAINALRGDQRLITKANYSKTLANSLPITTFSNSLHHFTINNIFAAATGYCLKSVIPKSSLPKPSPKVDPAECVESVQSRKSEIIDMIVATKIALETLEKKRKATSSVASDLAARYSKVTVLADAQKMRVDSLTPATFKAPVSNNAEDSSRVLKMALAEIKRADSRLTSTAIQSIESETHMVNNHGNALLDTQKSLEKVIARMETTKAEWSSDLESFRLWVLAADRTIGLINQPHLELGAFLVVKRAIERKDPYPYVTLCVEIWEDMRAEILCQGQEIY